MTALEGDPQRTFARHLLSSGKSRSWRLARLCGRAAPVSFLRPARVKKNLLGSARRLPTSSIQHTGRPEGRLVRDRPGRGAGVLATRADSKAVLNQDPSPSNERRRPDAGQNEQPVSNRAKAIFVAVLGAILVLGYLLMTELADDTSAEHCMMAHRKNCGAIEWPSK